MLFTTEASAVPKGPVATWSSQSTEPERPRQDLSLFAGFCFVCGSTSYVVRDSFSKGRFEGFVCFRFLVWSGLSRGSVLGGRGRGSSVSSAEITTAESTVMATTDSRATANCAKVTSEAGTTGGRSGVTSGTSGRFLLGLVLDEVDLGLAGLSRGWRRDDNVLLLVGLLNQHVDQGLLFVLGQNRNLRCLVGRGGRRLDEDDLVVLLGWGYRDRALGTDLLRLWWGHVHVDVLLDDGVLGAAAGRVSTAEAAAAAKAAGTATEAGTARAERGRTWRGLGVWEKINYVFSST